MKFPVVVGRAAREQLVGSAEWWSENRSAEQAELWHWRFVAAIEAIGDNPWRYPFAWENQFSKHEIRELHFGLGRWPTHRALFIVRSDLVYVFAIRHVAQEPLGSEIDDLIAE